MSEDNVVSIAKNNNDGTMVSPKMVLEDALSRVGNWGALESGKKCIVIALDDNDNNYSVSFLQAGLKMSECVALAEVAKSIFLSEMGYPQ